MLRDQARGVRAHAEKRGMAERDDAADGDHDQHIDEITEGECWIEADDLNRERAAKAREAAAKGEREHERTVDVDAEAARHALVVDRRAHLRTKAGFLQEENQ